jgi:hypothetical protein
VNVQSDDPAAVTEALVWAKKTWGQLVRLPGKSFPSLTSVNEEPNAQAAPAAVAQQSEAADPTAEEPPICEVHQVPMVHVNGRKGPFWSCHQKNEDGRWCAYRPQ